MPVVISHALVLSAPVEGGPDAPLIGWHNLVKAAGVAADEEVEGYPASNLANPSTALRWQAETTGEQYITFTVAGAEGVNYLAIARHNLGAGNVTISVEIPDLENPGDWIEIVSEMIPARNDAIVLHFEEVGISQIRLRLQPDATVPRIAVVYVGKLLRLQRGLQPGLVPITWGLSDTAISSESENGDYLGYTVLRQSLETSVSVQWLDYDWWSANMPDFIAHARQRKPFFFAWLPHSYPADVGYAWVTSDIRPEAHNTSRGIAMHVNLDMKAVAL